MTNEYDDPKFFEQYSKMPRSRQGLEAAGEWHQLKELFPDMSGSSVLDLGCGYGCTAGMPQSRELPGYWVWTSVRKCWLKPGGARERLLSIGCAVLRIMSIRLTSGILLSQILPCIILKIWRQCIKRSSRL